MSLYNTAPVSVLVFRSILDGVLALVLYIYAIPSHLPLGSSGRAQLGKSEFILFVESKLGGLGWLSVGI